MANQAILAALKEQVACYQRLAKLAAAQHEFVQNSRTEELLAILGERQCVLDQVADLEQIIGPLKKRWSEFLAALPAGDRGTAEAMLAETRRLLEEITTSDRNDALVLQQRKLNLGRQISQATVARQVNRTYAAAAYGPRRATMDVQR